MSSLRRLVFVLACVVISEGSSVAATFVVPSDRAMVQRADAIVVGSALGSYSQMIDGRIETVTSFSIHEVIKGSLGFTIEIHEPGGRVGDRMKFIPGVPTFEAGEESILFLSRTPQGTWAVTDIALGKFVFRTDQAGHKLAVRDEGEIHGWDPDGSSHIERHRAADAFLEFLRAEARQSSGRPDYFVPSYPIALLPNAFQPRVNAGFSATSYTSDVEFCPGASPPCGTGRGSRWNVFPGTTRTLYTEPLTPANALTATAAAINAWTNDPNSNVKYNTGTDPCDLSPPVGCKTGGLIGAADNLNTVLFERDLSSIGIPPFICTAMNYGGTFGIGGISNASGFHSGPNSESFFTTVEVDVEMNHPVLGCGILPQEHLDSAVTHEVGHTLGFRHSDQTRANKQTIPCSTEVATLDCENTTAIMRSFVPVGLFAALQTWDQHAVAAVYPCSVGGGCAPELNDMNNDNMADLIWRNFSTGEGAIWFMNNTSLSNYARIDRVTDVNWSIEGTGDIDGDGKNDLIWRNYSTGQNSVWYMNGAVATGFGVFDRVNDVNWRIEGIADFSGDGKPDLLWRNYLTGQNSIWIMNGTQATGFVQLETIGDTNWHIQAVGDFDGDGKPDIVWRNYVTGQNSYWYMDGTFVKGYGRLETVSDLNWHIVGAGDYNNDGLNDLVWRNYSTGQDSIWEMNNTAVVAYVRIDSITDLNWKLGGRGPSPR